MTLHAAFLQFTAQLTERYDPAEAKSIARIVKEDIFKFKFLPDREITAEENITLEKTLDCLLCGVPVQYIAGVAYFYGQFFKVNKDTLIPRPETEELVDLILKTVPRGGPPTTLLDIGTGSGCIAISIAKKRPEWTVWATDISAGALTIAQENAQNLGTPVAFLKNDALDETTWDQLPVCSVIVSNPPYIPFSEKFLMPEQVYAHEPTTALFVSNDDPLIFYRKIGQIAAQKLTPGGFLFFECNEFNTHKVYDLFHAPSWQNATIFKDISGKNRMFRVEKVSTP